MSRSVYNRRYIAEELAATAAGVRYCGKSNRVAKELPEVTREDIALLDRFTTGAWEAKDRWALQDLANRILREAIAEETPTAQDVVREALRELLANVSSEKYYANATGHRATVETLSAIQDAIDKTIDGLQ